MIVLLNGVKINGYLFLIILFIISNILNYTIIYADVNSPKLLDGLLVDALETQINPKAHRVDLGISFYFFDPYYTGVSATVGYTQQLSQKFAWQIVSASYNFAFQNGLTTQLADRWNVNPTQIERLSYIISSNIEYFFNYGKLIFFGDTIRYFRGSILIGGSIIGTTVQISPGATVGANLEVFINESFSWKLGVKDSMTIPSFVQYISFSVETGLSF